MGLISLNPVKSALLTSSYNSTTANRHLSNQNHHRSFAYLETYSPLMCGYLSPIKVYHHLSFSVCNLTHLTVALGKPPSLMVVVTTGRNHIKNMMVRPSAPSITFRPEEATLQDGKNGVFVSPTRR